VFHLAAKVGGFEYYVNHADEVYRDNLLMDRLMLKAVETNRVSCYFYASSAHIYPSEKQESSNTSPLREGDTQGGPPPISYGSAKRLGEQAVEFSVATNESLRAACLRLIGAYGRHQDIDLGRGSVIPVLIRRAIEYPKRKPFLLKTSGEESRSFCYVSDVIEAMLRSVEKLTDRRFIGPLNVGSEDSIRIIDLAQQIIRLSGKQIDPVQLSRQKSRIQSQRADCSKARVELDGWSPKISLIEGLRLTFVDVEKRLKPGRGGFRNRPTASPSPLQKHLRGELR
jgi:nucleoside-diphosphate-sugar epimerase